MGVNEALKHKKMTTHETSHRTSCSTTERILQQIRSTSVNTRQALENNLFTGNKSGPTQKRKNLFFVLKICTVKAFSTSISWTCNHTQYKYEQAISIKAPRQSDFSARFDKHKTLSKGTQQYQLPFSVVRAFSHKFPLKSALS